MIRIEDMTDEAYEGLLLPIWEYLAVEESPAKSDVIFVFGGLDLAVPARAAALYEEGWAPLVLVSGKSGPFSKDVFAQGEAIAFKDEMVRRGVPVEAIVLETEATNTGDNVALGMRVLRERGVVVDRAILVAKSFLMRRCIATFAKQCPNVAVRACPPKGSIHEFVDRPKREFAERLLAELERLDAYREQGYITKQTVPSVVEGAVMEVRLSLTA